MYDLNILAITPLGIYHSPTQTQDTEQQDVEGHKKKFPCSTMCLYQQVQF